MSKKCTYCNTLNTLEADFCTNCGKKLSNRSQIYNKLNDSPKKNKPKFKIKQYNNQYSMNKHYNLNENSNQQNSISENKDSNENLHKMIETQKQYQHNMTRQNSYNKKNLINPAKLFAVLLVVFFIIEIFVSHIIENMHRVSISFVNFIYGIISLIFFISVLILLIYTLYYLKKY